MPAAETSVHRFPQRLAFRAPLGLPAAVEAVARQRHTNPSEWIRQTVLRALEADGLRLSADGHIEPSFSSATPRKGACSAPSPIEARP